MTSGALIHDFPASQFSFLLQLHDAAPGLGKQMVAGIAVFQDHMVFLVGKGHIAEPSPLKDHVLS